MFYPACLGDNITTGTWAYKFTGFYGYRNFIMKDEAERILAAANSIWVYIDLHTGKPVKIPDDYPVSSGYDLEPEYPMEQVSRKIEMPSEYVQSASLLVVKSNIDSYNHVNNGQYIKLAENYLPDNFTIHSMRAEYRMQAVLGDVIVPLIAADYNRYTVALANEEMKPYAIIEFLR
jgi:acyl-ACP thioesterase